MDTSGTRAVETEIYRLDARGYYHSQRQLRRYPGSNGKLHRIIWAEAYGPIPPGCVVHHKNDDKEDNRLENLECLSKREHDRLHAKAKISRPWHLKKATEAMVAAGKAAWAVRPYREVTCVDCGTVFETRSTAKNVRYCSAACDQRQRRARGGR